MSAASMSLGPHVLFVSDLSAARDFYRDVLDFTIVGEDEQSVVLMVGEDMVLLVTDVGARELLGDVRLAVPSRDGVSGIFNLFVADVDEWFNRLTARGVSFLVAPVDRPWGRRTAHFADLNGVIWEISQSLED